MNQKPLAGIYNNDVLLPPGIGNIANNCYLNAILLCILNHPAISEVLTEMKQNVSSCRCQNSGILKILKIKLCNFNLNILHFCFYNAIDWICFNGLH